MVMEKHVDILYCEAKDWIRLLLHSPYISFTKLFFFQLAVIILRLEFSCAISSI